MSIFCTMQFYFYFIARETPHKFCNRYGAQWGSRSSGLSMLTGGSVTFTKSYLYLRCDRLDSHSLTEFELV